jgi:hypothetical protein
MNYLPSLFFTFRGGKMARKKREVVVKRFELRGKNELKKALEGLGFNVEAREEEEELDDEEELGTKVVGVFEHLRAFKGLGDYDVKVEVKADADTTTCSIVARRGFNIVLASKYITDPTPEQLIEAVEEVTREAEPKVKKWLGGVRAVVEELKKMPLGLFIATEGRAEASAAIRTEGREVGGIRVVAYDKGVAVQLQAWDLDYAKGVEVARRLIEALQGLGFEVAP